MLRPANATPIFHHFPLFHPFQSEQVLRISPSRQFFKRNFAEMPECVVSQACSLDFPACQIHMLITGVSKAVSMAVIG